MRKLRHELKTKNPDGVKYRRFRNQVFSKNLHVLIPGKIRGFEIPMVKDPMTLINDKPLCKIIESRCWDYVTFEMFKEHVALVEKAKIEKEK